MTHFEFFDKSKRFLNGDSPFVQAIDRQMCDKKLRPHTKSACTVSLGICFPSPPGCCAAKMAIACLPKFGALLNQGLTSSDEGLFGSF